MPQMPVKSRKYDEFGRNSYYELRNRARRRKILDGLKVLEVRYNAINVIVLVLKSARYIHNKRYYLYSTYCDMV